MSDYNADVPNHDLIPPYVHMKAVAWRGDTETAAVGSEWPSLESLQITNAGEGVEKRERSYTVGGNVSWCSHYGKQCGGSSGN